MILSMGLLVCFLNVSGVLVLRMNFVVGCLAEFYDWLTYNYVVH